VDGTDDRSDDRRNLSFQFPILEIGRMGIRRIVGPWELEASWKLEAYILLLLILIHELIKLLIYCFILIYEFIMF
jgi:hypothetical protein